MAMELASSSVCRYGWCVDTQTCPSSWAITAASSSSESKSRKSRPITSWNVPPATLGGTIDAALGLVGTIETLTALSMARSDLNLFTSSSSEVDDRLPCGLEGCWAQARADSSTRAAVTQTNTVREETTE